jgi:hypothetical protein
MMAKLPDKPPSNSYKTIQNVTAAFQLLEQQKFPKKICCLVPIPHAHFKGTCGGRHSWQLLDNLYTTFVVPEKCPSGRFCYHFLTTNRSSKGGVLQKTALITSVRAENYLATRNCHPGLVPDSPRRTRTKLKTWIFEVCSEEIHFVRWA